MTSGGLFGGFRDHPVPFYFLNEECEVVHTLNYSIPCMYCVLPDRVYFRRCYPEYFDYLIENIRTYQQISLVSTYGMGKTLFYLYFASRFRQEYPDVPIVVVKTRMDRHLEKCVLFPVAGEPINYGDEMPEIDGALYLYDGPPVSRALFSKMICFTLPNREWLSIVRASEVHLTMYFPDWTLEELKIGLRLKGDVFEEDKLQEDFNSFGGNPRYCLRTDAQFREKDLWEVTNAIATIPSLCEIMDQEDIFGVLFHMNPIITPETPPFVDRFSWKFASAEIESAFAENISKPDFYPVADLRMTANEPVLAGIAGWIFEHKVREVLQRIHQMTTFDSETGQSELLIWSDMKLLGGIKVVGSSWETSGSLLIFALAYQTLPRVSSQDILTEISRREIQEETLSLKLIWIKLDARNAGDDIQVEIPLESPSMQSNGVFDQAIAKMRQYHSYFAELWETL